VSRAEEFIELGERGWRWVLDQVRYDERGPWIAEPFDSDEDAGVDMYVGIGGLAHTLAELRLGRAWTDEEAALTAGIATRVRTGIATRTGASYTGGLASDIGVLEALDEPGSEEAYARLVELMRPDGWEQEWHPDLPAGATVNDIIGGTAGTLLAALWGAGDDAQTVAHRAADVLLAEAEPTDAGLVWPVLPRRWWDREWALLPNFSHGTAGIAATLALAGRMLDRPELIDASRRGAEALVAMADTAHDGFEVPTRIPDITDQEPFAYGWCHGPTGTSYLFAALELVGVDAVGGREPAEWHRRCLTSVVNSGLPMRIRPGFWDNDGRCCGTAGVGEAFLDSWQRLGDDYDLAFAETLGLALQERAIESPSGVCWRFTEHRNPDPLLPPGIGWMQGAAGISAYLLRLGRLLRDGREARSVERMDNWWALPR